jgi:transketolase
VRTAFVEELRRQAESDPSIMLITGDLGFGVLDDFRSRFPGQYLNAGVAEQNMATLAAGLALEGRKVFTYSIGNFPTLRSLEQIRNDICYHDLPVTVVSVGGGFSYGALGMSHHATEDIAIMRALPNMAVLTPGSREETRKLLPLILQRGKPAYLRLERSGENLPEGDAPFAFGKAQTLLPGHDVVILVAGGIVTEALKAARILEAEGVDIGVVCFHSVKPIDSEAIAKAIGSARVVVSLEEHSVVGGLGGAIAEQCLDLGLFSSKFIRLGIADSYSAVVGDQDFLRAYYGVDAAAVVTRVRAALS